MKNSKKKTVEPGKAKEYIEFSHNGIWLRLVTNSGKVIEQAPMSTAWSLATLTNVPDTERILDAFVNTKNREAKRLDEKRI